MTSVPAQPAATRSVMAGAAVWLVAAVALGASGVLSSGAVPPQVVPVMLWVLVGAQGLALWRVRGFRAWAMGVDVRGLIAIHVMRLVGFYFLWLHARGRLPDAFVVGGWGDIAVAVTAVGVCAITDARGTRARWVVLAWNIAGLIDILLVVATAARTWFTKPDAMVELTKLPLVLLPTFLVPIIIVSHGVMLVRLRARAGVR